jgi:hypothetical protein
MKMTLKLALTVAPMVIAMVAVSEPVVARGGAANIMNSPGYQRRLQESRQQLPPTDASAAMHRHKPRHHPRHSHRH